MPDKRKNVFIGDSCNKPSAKITSGKQPSRQGSVDKPPARKPNVGSGDTKK